VGNRHKRSVSMYDAYPYRPRGPNGERYCRYCGQQVPKGRRTWCSDECVDEASIRCNPSHAAYRVGQRDKGVCAICGVDTKILKKRAIRERGEFLAEMMDRGFPDVWREWWEADHIIPVSEGGGHCGLENYRTLCVPCHKSETAKLRKRLAKRNQDGTGA